MSNLGRYPRENSSSEETENTTKAENEKWREIMGLTKRKIARKKL
jgi:hypothetical protein